VRNGPLVHRRAQVSRFAYGTPTPLERLASLTPLGTPRPFSRRVRAQRQEPQEFEPVRLSLGSRLPINLRNFLNRELSAIARIEEDTIVAIGARSSEMLMRELARAIRRFSAERARETWSECAIGLERLEHEFFGPDSDGRSPVVLCLRCAAIGTGALEQHCGPNCLAVDLGAAVKADRIERGPSAPGSNAMHRAVENFRAARESAGLEHHELDCYVAGAQVIFTWHPLPALH
jgi:hypothetical protein